MQQARYGIFLHGRHGKLIACVEDFAVEVDCLVCHCIITLLPVQNTVSHHVDAFCPSQPENVLLLMFAGDEDCVSLLHHSLLVENRLYVLREFPFCHACMPVKSPVGRQYDRTALSDSLSSTSCGFVIPAGMDVYDVCMKFIRHPLEVVPARDDPDLGIFLLCRGKSQEMV